MRKLLMLLLKYTSTGARSMTFRNSLSLIHYEDHVGDNQSRCGVCGRYKVRYPDTYKAPERRPKFARSLQFPKNSKGIYIMGEV